MKDHRFIELVNLYVDRQISAAETAELEEEIQLDPRRRAIYRQYCQMHRATALVYESFRADNPGQQPAAAGNAHIARFEHGSGQRRTNWAYYAGGLAAACLALVLARVHFNQAATPNLAAAPKVAQPVAVAVVAVPAPVPARPAEAQPGLVSLRNNSLATEPDYAALLAEMRRQERQAFANGEIQPARLPSLFDDGVFDSQQISPANNQRTFRGKQAPAAQVSYQFQR